MNNDRYVAYVGTYTHGMHNDELRVHYGQGEKIDVYAKMTTAVMDNIIQGRMSFQRAFMTGEMTAKGNFKTLKMLDQVFIFG